MVKRSRFISVLILQNGIMYNTNITSKQHYVNRSNSRIDIRIAYLCRSFWRILYGNCYDCRRNTGNSRKVRWISAVILHYYWCGVGIHIHNYCIRVERSCRYDVFDNITSADINNNFKLTNLKPRSWGF